MQPPVWLLAIERAKRGRRVSRRPFHERPRNALRPAATPEAEEPSNGRDRRSPLRTGPPTEPVTWNFKLLAHHELDGFGGMGEGMSMQIAPDGRRILWLAHESAPKNFTAVDVSDPRKPKVVVPDRPAAEPHALELARDLRQHHGGRLPDPEERA